MPSKRYIYDLMLNNQNFIYIYVTIDAYIFKNIKEYKNFYRNILQSLQADGYKITFSNHNFYIDARGIELPLKERGIQMLAAEFNKPVCQEIHQTLIRRQKLLIKMIYWGSCFYQKCRTFAMSCLF